MTDRPLVHVSDHAIVRWLERVEGFDFSKLRVDLGRAGAVGVSYGAKIVVVAGGKLIVENDVVVTVVARDAGETRPDVVEISEPVVSMRSIAPMRRPKRRRG